MLIAIKFAAALVTPLIACLGMLTLALARMRRGAQREAFRFCVLAMIVLAAVATPAVARLLAFSLEKQYPARSLASLPATDVAIVLGGATRRRKTLRMVWRAGNCLSAMLRAFFTISSSRISGRLFHG